MNGTDNWLGDGFIISLILIGLLCLLALGLYINRLRARGWKPDKSRTHQPWTLPADADVSIQKARVEHIHVTGGYRGPPDNGKPMVPPTGGSSLRKPDEQQPKEIGMFQTYKDKRGEWRWRFVDKSFPDKPKTLFVSSEGYKKRADMLQCLSRARGSYNAEIEHFDFIDGTEDLG